MALAKEEMKASRRTPRFHRTAGFAVRTVKRER